MSRSVYKDVTVEVDIDLDDFSDEELIEELSDRGISNTKDVTSIDKLYRNFITLSPEAFNKELKRFFRENLDVLEY